MVSFFFFFLSISHFLASALRAAFAVLRVYPVILVCVFFFLFLGVGVTGVVYTHDWVCLRVLASFPSRIGILIIITVFC